MTAVAYSQPSKHQKHWKKSLFDRILKTSGVRVFLEFACGSYLVL